jgi:hypothetical protein
MKYLFELQIKVKIDVFGNDKSDVGFYNTIKEYIFAFIHYYICFVVYNLSMQSFHVLFMPGF